MQVGPGAGGGDQPPLNARSLLVEALRAAAAGFGPYLAITLTCHLPTLVWMGLKRAEESAPEPGVLLPDLRMALLTVVLSVPAVVAQVAIIFGTLDRMQGRTSTTGELLGQAFSRLLPTLAVAFTFIAAVALGVILFVVPGILLACMLFVALPAVAVEGGGVGSALLRSALLTRGHRWAIFWILVVLGLAQAGAAVLLEAGRGEGAPGPAYLVGVWVFQSLFTILIATSNAVTYIRLRQSKGN